MGKSSRRTVAAHEQIRLEARLRENGQSPSEGTELGRWIMCGVIAASSTFISFQFEQVLIAVFGILLAIGIALSKV